MSASPKTLLVVSSLAAFVAAPCIIGVSDARAQASGTPGSAPSGLPACNSKPTPQDSEAAHSAYLLGKRFFDESDYGSASHNFSDAYKLDCTKPELLLNIARANELLGNRAEAVHALETYLQQRSQTLSPDEKAQYQRRIDNLKAAMGAQAVAPAPTAPAAPTAPVATTPPPPAPPPSTTPPAPVPPPAPAPEGHGHTVAPWVVAGVGGAAVLAGAAMYLVGAGDVSDAKSTCGTSGTNCPNTPAGAAAASKGNTGDTLEKAGAATFYVGIAAAAGGVLWHFLEPTGPAAPSDAPRASFTPVFGPGYTGASVVGRF